MISNSAALWAALFFFHCAFASFVAGYKLWPKKDLTVKYAGMAFIFSGLAFTTWTFLAANHLNNLRVLAAIAAIFLILSLLSFMMTGIQHLQAADSYGTALLVGAILAVGLFVLRTFVYPSQLIFTDRGFLVFDLHPAVKAAYIIALSGGILPAAGALSGKFKTNYLNPLFKGCCTALCIGGIIFVTTTDTTLIVMTGAVLSIALLMLWATLLFGDPKALEKVD